MRGFFLALECQYRVSFYPNPTDDKVNVTVSSASPDKRATAFLMDNSGRTLQSQEVNADPFSFDMTKYPPGTYLIKVIIGKEQLSYQVLKSN
jgi:hypothetical protein